MAQSERAEEGHPEDPTKMCNEVQSNARRT